MQNDIIKEYNTLHQTLKAYIDHYLEYHKQDTSNKAILLHSVQESIIALYKQAIDPAKVIINTPIHGVQHSCTLYEIAKNCRIKT